MQMNSNRLAHACLSLGLFVLTVSPVWAAGSKTTMLEGYCVRHVKSGETVETPGAGTAGYINENLSGGGVTSSGDYVDSTCAILLEDGGKIVYTDGINCWPAIVMTNGTATIELAASSTTFGFNRHVLLRGGAQLIVKAGANLEYIILGHDTYRPYYELAGLQVLKGETDATHRMFFCSSARPLSMPAKWLADYKPNASIGRGDVFLIEDIYRDFSGTIANLPGGRTYLASPDILRGRDISLGTSGQLHLTPFKYEVASDANYETIADCLARVNATVKISYDVPGTNYAVNVAFADTTGVLALDTGSSASAKKGSSFTGTVTGAGTIQASFLAGVTSAKPNQLALSGDFSAFSGTLSATCAATPTSVSAPIGTLVVSNDLAQATVSPGAGAQVLFAPATAAISAKAVAGESLLGAFGAAAGKTLTVGSVSGLSCICGEGAVVCTSVEPGTTLVNDSAATYPESARVFALNDANEHVASRFAEAGETDLDVASFVSVLVWPFSYRAIGATAGTRLVNVPAGTVLDTATPVVVATSNAEVSFAGAGALAFDRLSAGGWTNRVDFWFDFSRTNELRGISYAADTPDPNKLRLTASYGGKNCPVFERCVDWRYPEREGTLWNGLYYVTTECNATHVPIAATNMYQHQEGFSYMTFGDRSSSRLPFAFSRSKANEGEATAMQYVVMVYSSRLGGGTSLVADPAEYFRREQSKSPIKPFVASTNSWPKGLAIRADGQTLADPSTTCPNGDWQIVTLKMDGATFKGLGFYGNYKQNGNGYSEYGEVMLFTNAVDYLCVLEAEQYLAKKWNLPCDTADLLAARAAHVATQTNTVAGAGSSAARVQADGFATYRVAGAFAGEVALDGGKLVVDATLPWTEAQVAAVEGRTFWFDGDDRSSVKLVSDYLTSKMSSIQSNQVRVVKDKFDATFHTGPLMAGISTRMPYLFREARRFGPERNWIDFCEWYAADQGPGNMMRMIKPYASEDWGAISNDPYTMDVRTILFAHDSTNGGGNPVMDTSSASGHFGQRATTDPSMQVWKASTGGDCAAFRNGLNRIDGVTQTNPNGFGGRPEVYTVRGTDSISAQYYIDVYMNSQTPSDRRAACVGEILYYSTALTDEEISGIESYLMGKWLGLLPSGYGDVRAATVTGSGAVEAADLARLPKIASNFTGTVTALGSTGEITMTVDALTRKVNGAIVNSGATFTLPATVTIKVVFAEADRKRIRSNYLYPLVDAAGAENTTWTVDLSDASVPRNIASVVRDGGRIYLKVEKRGMALYVR